MHIAFSRFSVPSPPIASAMSACTLSGWIEFGAIFHFAGTALTNLETLLYFPQTTQTKKAEPSWQKA